MKDAKEKKIRRCYEITWTLEHKRWSINAVFRNKRKVLETVVKLTNEQLYLTRALVQTRTIDTEYN